MGYLAALAAKAAGEWLHMPARMPRPADNTPASSLRNKAGQGCESGIPRVLPLSGTWAKGSGARTVCKVSISHPADFGCPRPLCGVSPGVRDYVHFQTPAGWASSQQAAPAGASTSDALTRKRTSSKPFSSSLLSYCCRPMDSSHSPTLCSSVREPDERGIGRRLNRENPLRR